jgi:hypothetical protein
MLTFGWGPDSEPDGFSSLSDLYLLRARWRGHRILCAVTAEVLEDVLRIKLPLDRGALSADLTERLREKFLTIANEARLKPTIGRSSMPGFLLTIQDF